MQENDRRAYQRATHLNLVAKVSLDGDEWHHARVSDISAGGLSFASTVDYAIGSTLWFDLHIESFFSEFEVKTRGQIRRKQRLAVENAYGVEFVGLSESAKIRIDANVHGDRIIGHGTYQSD